MTPTRPARRPMRLARSEQSSVQRQRQQRQAVAVLRDCSSWRQGRCLCQEVFTLYRWRLCRPGRRTGMDS